MSHNGLVNMVKINVTDKHKIFVAEMEINNSWGWGDGGWGAGEWGGENYDGYLLSATNIQKTDHGISNMTLRILDKEGYIRDMILNLGAHALVNKPVVVKQLDIRGMKRQPTVIMIGFTDQGIRYGTDRVVTIPVVDGAFKEHPDIPKKLINSDKFSDVDDGAVNEAYQIVYGSVTEGICPYIDDVNFKYLVAGHEMKASSVSVYKDGVIVASGVSDALGLDDEGGTTYELDFDSDQTDGEISCSIDGRPDAGGSITGTPDTLIEMPHNIIESILLDEAGIVGESIDMSDKTDLDTKFSTWKFAKFVTDQQTSYKHIQDLIGNTVELLKYVRNETDGTHYFYKGGESADSIEYYFEENLNIVEWKEKSPLPFLITQTDFDDVYAEIYLKFNYNYRDDSYWGQVHGQGNSLIDAGYQSKLATAIANYGTNKTLNLELDWVTDSTTAIAIMTRAVDIYSQARHKVKFYGRSEHDSFGNDVKQMRRGAVIGITHRVMKWVTKKFEVTTIKNLDEGTLLIDAIEIII